MSAGVFMAVRMTSQRSTVAAVRAAPMIRHSHTPLAVHRRSSW